MGLLQAILKAFGKEAIYSGTGKRVRSDLKIESLSIGGKNTNSSRYTKSDSLSKIKIRDKK